MSGETKQGWPLVCSAVLRREGKPYPRTCSIHGILKCEANLVVANRDNIDELFEGVMVPVVREASKPGWRCRKCGWTVGSQGLPPSHSCPDDGFMQRNLF